MSLHAGFAKTRGLSAKPTLDHESRHSSAAAQYARPFHLPVQAVERKEDMLETKHLES